jgi:hypothetical protein
MTRIEYFNNELSMNKGYEHDMALVAMMTNEEICECFNIDPEDIANIEYFVRDAYAFDAPAEDITPAWGYIDPAFSSLYEYNRMRY